MRIFSQLRKWVQATLYGAIEMLWESPMIAIRWMLEDVEDEWLEWAWIGVSLTIVLMVLLLPVVAMIWWLCS